MVVRSWDTEMSLWSRDDTSNYQNACISIQSPSKLSHVVIFFMEWFCMKAILIINTPNDAFPFWTYENDYLWRVSDVNSDRRRKEKEGLAGVRSYLSNRREHLLFLIWYCNWFFSWSIWNHKVKSIRTRWSSYVMSVREVKSISILNVSQAFCGIIRYVKYQMDFSDRKLLIRR